MRAVAPIAVLALCACHPKPEDRPDRPTPPTGTPTGLPTGTTTPAPFAFEVLPEVLLDKTPGEPVHATNIRLAPLDWGPGLELVLSEAAPPGLTWLGCDGGACLSERLPLAPDVVPARTSTTDLDGDGDSDLVVSSIGSLGPTNQLTGSLWIYWREGPVLVPELVLDQLPRLVCAEPGDLDGDGDLDLALCAFGHVTVGEVAWLEQGASGWIYNVIDPRPGAIHAFPADLDGDGDLDLVAGVAQLAEELVFYRNDGYGGFSIETVFSRGDTWFGLSGIELVDLDQDGDLDVLLTNGDTLDGDLPEDVDPNALHAVRWFENDGSAGFTEHEIFQSWGCYTVRAADLDGDDDLDVLLGNFQNTRLVSEWPQPAELWALENDGSQNFTPHEVPGAPPQLISIEVGDADQDGDIDVFAASLGIDGSQDKERLVLLENITGE